MKALSRLQVPTAQIIVREVVVVADAEPEVEQVSLRQRIGGGHCEARAKDEVVLGVVILEMHVVVVVEAQGGGEEQSKVPGAISVRAFGELLTPAFGC
jgi:hypothetical protein